MLQATIKRAPSEARRSLADLFGSDMAAPTAKPPPPPQRRTLASLFPTEDPEIAKAEQRDAAAGGSEALEEQQDSLAAAETPPKPASRQPLAQDADGPADQRRLQHRSDAARDDAADAVANAAASPLPEDDGAAVVSPRQQPVATLRQQIEARSGMPGSLRARFSSLDLDDAPGGGSQALLARADSPALAAGADSTGSRAPPAAKQVPAPSATLMEPAAAAAEVDAAPPQPSAGSFTKAPPQLPPSPLADAQKEVETLEGAASASAVGDGAASEGSPQSTEPSPHRRLHAAYAHLSTSPGGEDDHQLSNGSARGGLCGVAAQGGGGGSQETGRKDAGSSEIAAVADASLAAPPRDKVASPRGLQGSGGFESVDGGSHPRSRLGSMASLAGVLLALLIHASGKLGTAGLLAGLSRQIVLCPPYKRATAVILRLCKGSTRLLT